MIIRRVSPLSRYGIEDIASAFSPLAQGCYVKKIVILGSTGSIGVNALEVVDKLGPDYKLLAISAHSNIKSFLKQIHKFKPKYAAIFDFDAHNSLKKILPKNIKLLAPGIEGLCEMASLKEADIILNAVSGSVGFAPLIASIRASKHIALANKEPMVMAGENIMKEAFRWKANIIPVDSEPSAIFQCLQDFRGYAPAYGGTGQGKKYDDVISRIFLTASGGAFYKYKHSLERVTPRMALKHPNWKMGAKITIDSSTLMNKGLEAIEIKNFFAIDIKKINIVVHPQSIVHSAVELKDKSVLAQMSSPDMKLPIQYAITYPERRACAVKPMDFLKLAKLDFVKPDFKKFPCLELAFDSARKGGSYPCALNAANEVAVESFLKGGIGFCDIPRIIAKVLSLHRPISSVIPSFSDISEIDEWARVKAQEVISATARQYNSATVRQSGRATGQQRDRQEAWKKSN